MMYQLEVDFSGSGVNFEENRTRLAHKVFDRINRQAFDSKLQNVSIVWTSRLNKKSSLSKINRQSGDCVISLSKTRIVDLQKMITQLAHEMCHVAVYKFQGIYSGKHDDHWLRYTRCITRNFHDIEFSTMSCLK
ncbi:XE [Alphabaculovirus myunipunctae]|uniref:XE n=1 Tax=Mythimna unipuncta nucleopolyhedrovirus TaxID=447897 RepID=A0A2K9VS99_9ABAC|nr:XE [Mythimna unipuncta nucleopolyhedrovirus]AUV65333.1 XE [Mythimna unipuncta nucleopolyhedrovirus]